MSQNYIVHLVPQKLIAFVSFVFKKMKNKKFTVGLYYGISGHASGLFFQESVKA